MNQQSSGLSRTAIESPFELPPGWRWVSVGSVATVDSGPAFKSKLFGGPDDGTRLLRGDNIEPGRLRWGRTRTWPNELLSNYRSLLVDTNDIILAMDRPVVSAGLKIARVAQDDLPALLVQRVARIRPRGEILANYLYRVLQSSEFVNHLRGNEVGTQLPHVTLQSVREFEFALPPQHEQRRIVDILDDHFSRSYSARARGDAGRKVLGQRPGRLASRGCAVGCCSGGYAYTAGAVAGGSQGPVVNSCLSASSLSMPHLAAVDR